MDNKTPTNPLSKKEFFETLRVKTDLNTEYIKDQKDLDNLNDILRNAYDIRKVELDLYWKRAGYFWAFIAVSFTAYFIVAEKFSTNDHYQLLITCIGFICSLSWYLVNRGSTYWLANWERVIDTIESEVGKELYKLNLTNKNHVLTFWKLHAHSVSRINIMVSFVIFVAWFGLLFNTVIHHYKLDDLVCVLNNNELKYFLPLLGTCSVAIYLIFFTTSGLEETYSFNKRNSDYEPIEKKTMTDNEKVEADRKERNKKATTIVLKSYFKAFIIIALTIIVSFLLKKCMDWSDYKCVSLIGVAIPTFGTVGFLTWHINVNTLGGESFPEKLNRTILYITYILGIVLYILGTSL